MSTAITLDSIYQALTQAGIQADIHGDKTLLVSRLSHPRFIQDNQDLVYAIEPQALLTLPGSPVKAAIVSAEMSISHDLLCGWISVARPRVALAVLLNLLDTPVHTAPGIHPTAVISDTADIDPSVRIGALSFVGEGAKIGPNSILMPQVTIGAEAVIGADCLFHPGTRIGERVRIGNHVIIHHNASVGADGFSFVTPEKGSVETAKESGGKIKAKNTDLIRINSVGTVIVGNHVEIGACSTIDRATLGATVIGNGTKIDNLVMIGHNNVVGENCLIVSQVGVSGSCKIGNRVVLAGQVGIKDHITIGDDAIVMAKGGVMNDLPEGAVVVGQPAIPQREAFQQLGYIARLKDMHRDLVQMKKRLDTLEKSAQQNPAVETSLV